MWSCTTDIEMNFALLFESFLKENSILCERVGKWYIFTDSRLAVRLVYLKEFEPLQNASSFSGKEFFAPEQIEHDCRNIILQKWDILYLFEDRWLSNSEYLKRRLLSRLGSFTSVFARKCRVIDNSAVKSDSTLHLQIKEFLRLYHTYSFTKCKYEYALEHNGEIVAVATFSYPKKIFRPEYGREYFSYEWIRYASLPGVRVVGGMGRLLSAFLKSVTAGQNNRDIEQKSPVPDNLHNLNDVEIMSYSDNEWSQGDVYEKLSFKRVEERESVLFYVDKSTFRRYSVREFSKLALCEKSSPKELFQSGRYIKIFNMGSAKFLLHP